jgi:hypothetical protein
MPKIDLDKVKLVLQRNEPDPRKVADIINELQMEIQAEEEEKALRPPPVKKEFLFLLSDPNGKLRGEDLVGWVVQIPEGDSPLTAPERIVAAANAFNGTGKGRRLALETIGEACEMVSPRLFKEQNIWIKTKMPVQALPLPNKMSPQVKE